jgi:hypothetical protein
MPQSIDPASEILKSDNKTVLTPLPILLPPTIPDLSPLIPIPVILHLAVPPPPTIRRLVKRPLMKSLVKATPLGRLPPRRPTATIPAMQAPVIPIAVRPARAEQTVVPVPVPTARVEVAVRAVTLQLDPLGPTTDSKVGLLEDNEAVAVGLLDEVDLCRSDRVEEEADLLEVVEAEAVGADEEEVVAPVVPEAIQALAALAALADKLRSDRVVEVVVEADPPEGVEAVVVVAAGEEVVAPAVPGAIQALVVLAALVDKLRSDRVVEVVVEADPPEGVEAVVVEAAEEGAAQVLGPLRNDKPDPVELRLNYAYKYHIRH